MTWESLDFIDARYEINENGEVRCDGVKLAQGENSHGDATVFINRKKVSLARLVAEIFVPNPFKLNRIGFKDGKKSNCKASNLVWVSNRKEYESSNKKVSRKEAKAIRCAINNAIDNQEWAQVECLSRLLCVNETSIRQSPTVYPTIRLTPKVNTMSPILKVFTVEDGVLNYCSTKEVVEQYDIKPSTVYKKYTQLSRKKEKGVIYLEPVAIVSRNFINAQIQVIKDNDVIDVNSYTQTCMKYDIHFEDLRELVRTTKNPILYKGLQFKIARKD